MKRTMYIALTLLLVMTAVFGAGKGEVKPVTTDPDAPVTLTVVLHPTNIYAMNEAAKVYADPSECDDQRR